MQFLMQKRDTLCACNVKGNWSAIMSTSLKVLRELFVWTLHRTVVEVTLAGPILLTMCGKRELMMICSCM